MARPESQGTPWARPTRGACLALLLGLSCCFFFGWESFASQRAAGRVKEQLRKGQPIQVAILAVPEEDRRFTLELVAQPAERTKTSKLAFAGRRAFVTARDEESRGGWMPPNEALAQLGGEIASVESGVVGWKARLHWAHGHDTYETQEVELDREGRIR